MKTALITGANQGIGLETARQLSAQGYFVYIGCRDKEKGRAALHNLHASGHTHAALLLLDVTDSWSIQSARGELEEKIKCLDLLINNAGIAGSQPQDMIEGDPGELRKIFDTNFFGAVQTTQQFIPLLRLSDDPRIINVSSSLGSLATQSSSQNPNHRLYDFYSASKTALNAFTVLLARQLQNSSIKVNSIEPGYTATNLNQYKGMQTVDQAARIIVTFAMLERQPTGKNIGSDGAVSAW